MASYSCPVPSTSKSNNSSKMDGQKVKSLIFFVAESAFHTDPGLRSIYGCSLDLRVESLKDWTLLAAAVRRVEALQNQASIDEKSNEFPGRLLSPEADPSIARKSLEERQNLVRQYLAANSPEEFALLSSGDLSEDSLDLEIMKMCVLVFVSGMYDERTRGACARIIGQDDGEVDVNLAHVMAWFNERKQNWPDILFKNVSEWDMLNQYGRFKVKYSTPAASKNLMNRTPQRPSTRNQKPKHLDEEIFEGSPHLRAVLDSPVSKYQFEIRAKEMALNNVKAENTELAQKMDEMSSQNEELTKQLEESRRENGHLHANLRLLKMELGAAFTISSPDSKDGFRKQIYERNIQIHELQEQLENFEKMETDLTETRNKLKKSEFLSEEMQRKMEAEEQSTKKSLRLKQDMIEELETEVMELNQRIVLLEDDKRQLKDQLDEKNQLEVNLRRCEELVKKFRDLSEQRDCEVTEMRRQLDHEKEVRQQTEEEKDQVERKLIGEQGDSQFLREQLAYYRDLEENLIRKNHRLSASFENLDVGSATSIHRLEHCLQRERQKMQSMEREVEELQERLLMERGEKNCQEIAKNVAEQQLTELFKERDELKSALKKSNEVQDEQKMQISLLESDVQSAKLKFEDACTKLENTELILESHKGQLTGTKVALVMEKNRLASKEEQVESQEKLLREQKERIHGLTEEFRLTSSQLEDLLIKLETEGKKRAALENEMKEKEDEMGARLRSAENLTKQWKESTEKTAEALKAVYEKNRQVEARNEEEIQNLRSVVDEQTGQLCTLQLSSAELTQRWEAEIKMRREEREHAADKKRSLRAELDLERQSLMAKIKILEEERRETGRKLEEVEEEAQSLKTDLDEAQQVLTMEESELADTVEKLRDLEEETEKGRKTFDIEKEIRIAVEESLQRRVAELTEAIDSKNAELTARAEEKLNLMEQLRNINEELGKIRNSNEELREEVEELRTAFENEKLEKETEMEEWRNALEEKNSEVETVKVELASQKEEVESLTHDLEQAQLTVEELKAANKKTEGELVAAKKNIEELTSKNEGFVRENDQRSSLRSNCPSIKSIGSQASALKVRFDTGDDEGEVLEESTVTVPIPSSSYSFNSRSVIPVVMEPQHAGAIISGILANSENSESHLNTQSALDKTETDPFQTPKASGDGFFKIPKDSVSRSFFGGNKGEESFDSDVSLDYRSRAEKLSFWNKKLPPQLRSSNPLEFTFADSKDKIDDDLIKAGNYKPPPKTPQDENRDPSSVKKRKSFSQKFRKFMPGARKQKSELFGKSPNNLADLKCSKVVQSKADTPLTAYKKPEAFFVENSPERTKGTKMSKE